MGCRSFSYNSLFPSLLRVAKSHWLPLSQRLGLFSLLFLFGDLYFVEILVLDNLFVAIAELTHLCCCFRSKVFYFYDSGPSVLQHCCKSGSLMNFQGNLCFKNLLTGAGLNCL